MTCPSPFISAGTDRRLLALLYLGIKRIRRGLMLPGILSPGVVKVLVDAFDIKPTTDIAAIKTDKSKKA